MDDAVFLAVAKAARERVADFGRKRERDLVVAPLTNDLVQVAAAVLHHDVHVVGRVDDVKNLADRSARTRAAMASQRSLACR